MPRDVRYYFALKMRGQGLALGPRLGSCLRISRVGSRFRRCLRGLQFFQFQFELFQLNRDLLALASEYRSPQLLDNQLQVFDLLLVRAKRRPIPIVLLNQQRLQRFYVEPIERRQRGGVHERSMPRSAVERSAKSLMNTSDYYASAKRP